MENLVATEEMKLAFFSKLTEREKEIVDIFEARFGLKLDIENSYVEYEYNRVIYFNITDTICLNDLVNITKGWVFLSEDKKIFI